MKKRNRNTCAAAACVEFGHRLKSRSFHAFPRDRNVRFKWAELLNIPINSVAKYETSKKFKVCGNHFTEDCFIFRAHQTVLKPYAIPTLRLEKGCVDPSECVINDDEVVTPRSAQKQPEIDTSLSDSHADVKEDETVEEDKDEIGNRVRPKRRAARAAEEKLLEVSRSDHEIIEDDVEEEELLQESLSAEKPTGTPIKTPDGRIVFLKDLVIVKQPQRSSGISNGSSQKAPKIELVSRNSSISITPINVNHSSSAKKTSKSVRNPVKSKLQNRSSYSVPNQVPRRSNWPTTKCVSFTQVKHLDVQMECDEEALSPIQVKAHNQAVKDYQQVMNKIKKLSSENCLMQYENNTAKSNDACVQMIRDTNSSPDMKQNVFTPSGQQNVKQNVTITKIPLSQSSQNMQVSSLWSKVNSKPSGRPSKVTSVQRMKMITIKHNGKTIGIYTSPWYSRKKIVSDNIDVTGCVKPFSTPADDEIFSRGKIIDDAVRIAGVFHNTGNTFGDWLVSKQLQIITCPKCQGQHFIKCVDNDEPGQPTYHRCVRCSEIQDKVVNNSFFDSLSIPVMEQIQFLYHWAFGNNAALTNVIPQFLTNVRELCSRILEENFSNREKSECITIEIDAMKLDSTISLLVMYNIRSDVYYLLPYMPDHFGFRIEDVIRRTIMPPVELITCNLDIYFAFSHDVNYRASRVPDNDVEHINSDMLQHICSIIPPSWFINGEDSGFTIKLDALQQVLDEFCWREKFGSTGADAFISIIHHITYIYQTCNIDPVVKFSSSVPDSHTCVECRQPITTQHYSTKYFNCLLCSFRSMCEAGSWNHIAACVQDVKKLSPLPNNIQSLNCHCGYITKDGNEMVHHLMKCEEEMCYIVGLEDVNVTSNVRVMNHENSSDMVESLPEHLAPEVKINEGKDGDMVVDVNSPNVEQDSDDNAKENMVDDDDKEVENKDESDEENDE